MSYVWTTKSLEATRCGLSSHGLKQLGDVCWIELPPVGTCIEIGETLLVVESSKAAIEIESPLRGRVRACEEVSLDLIQRVKSEPESVWLLELEA